jgi:hypothetical protein
VLVLKIILEVHEKGEVVEADPNGKQQNFREQRRAEPTAA